MKLIRYLLFLCGTIFSCQQEFIPAINSNQNQIVVEGYIEASERATPAYVILTRTIPFFHEFNTSQNFFVSGATVYVSNDQDSVRLTEICWTDLDSATKKTAANLFGINLDSVGSKFNFCVYADISQKIKGEYGRSYHLTVRKDTTLLSATTTRPQKVPVDSVRFIKPPGGNKNDTMAQMQCYFNDPTELSAYYYRVLNAVNEKPYKAGSFSVVDDQFFHGQTVKFNLFNAYKPRVDKTEIQGLFYRGDTASVKLCGIDRAHFDFWNTLELNANNQGPFASYTRVKYNIVGNGGIGIWGGYAVAYYTAVVPTK